MGHAVLSPSAAHRWLACTPSARFEEQIPDETSEYAAEGTLAHELAALLLSSRAGVFNGSNDTFNAMLAKIYDNPLYSREMYEHCEAYVAFVLERGTQVLIEHTYDLSEFTPCCYGTADATVRTENTIYVTDFKYGAGVKVPATGNKQLMLYGLGAYQAVKDPKIETVVLSIFQPRAGGASTWELPVTDLLQWADTELKPKAALAVAGGGNFLAGDHCRFCKARTRCRAHYLLYSVVRNTIPPDPREMTDNERREVLTHGDTVTAWINAVKADAVTTLEKGGTIPGFKLVAGRGKRAFKNEDDVVDTLLGAGYESDQIFAATLQSLTAIEKLVGPKQFKQLFADNLTTVAGRPQLVDENDPRPSIDGSAADEYD